MSQDIQFIKKILSTCEEIDSIFDIKKGDIVRYITIDDGSEFFYFMFFNQRLDSLVKNTITNYWIKMIRILLVIILFIRIIF